MNKKCYVVISLCLCFVSTKIKATGFEEVLSNYCIPKDENGCISGIKATYDSKTGYCVCDTVYKHYASDLRGCEECIHGSYASFNWKTCEPLNCPDGMVPVLIEDGNCPYGYALTQVENGNCGEGYSLKEYDLSTKTFK